MAFILRKSLSTGTAWQVILEYNTLGMTRISRSKGHRPTVGQGGLDAQIVWRKNQNRASRARESSITHKSAITDHAVEENHVIDWDKAKVVDWEAQRQTRWIKEALWIRKTPMCMNWDAGSYQLSHTWDQVISRSRAPSSCKQSKRDQDVRSDGHRNVVIRLGIITYFQLCKVSSVTMAPGWAMATAGINSKVDVCEKAKHHTELFW